MIKFVSTKLTSVSQASIIFLKDLFKEIKPIRKCYHTWVSSKNEIENTIEYGEL